ncbi:MAG: phosphodiesterase [Rhodocyclaceae bacterium]|nr:phosphodiesterase [Rhodocyclaceae bacterium]
MKIIHLSDLHLVAPGHQVGGRDPAQSLARALTLVRRDHADAAFCLLTGDLADAGEEAAYAELTRQLADLPMPCYVMPGNHDERAHLRKAFPDLPLSTEGFIQQALPTPAGLFLLLDTLNAGRPGGWYDDARALWLRQQLTGAGEQAIFLAMHHPPFAVGIPSMDRYALRDTAHFDAALKGYEARVRHIFIGHLHRPIGGSWRGMSFSGVSSPNHQVALDMNSCPESGDVPGCLGHPAFGVILIDETRVVVHHHFLDHDDAQFVL